MSFWNGKSNEEEEYERGQDVGAHQGPAARGFASLMSGLLPDSEYKAFQAGLKNGEDNPKE